MFWFVFCQFPWASAVVDARGFTDDYWCCLSLCIKSFFTLWKHNKGGGGTAEICHFMCNIFLKPLVNIQKKPLKGWEMLSDSSLLKSRWCRLAHYVLPVLTRCKVFCLICEGFVTLLPLLLLTTCSNNTRCAGYLVVKRAKRGWHDFLLRCHSAINFLKVVKHGVMSNVATYIILGARITGVSIHRNHMVRFTQLPTVPNKVLSVSHLLREMTTLIFFSPQVQTLVCKQRNKDYYTSATWFLSLNGNECLWRFCFYN